MVVELCPFCLPDVPHMFPQHAKAIKMSMITLKQLLKRHLIFEKHRFMFTFNPFCLTKSP